jgi:DNA-binding PadR family transcriptional regulator
MEKIELNKLISRQSGELFRLDDLEQHLLGWISRGENTIYGLEKLAQEHNREMRAKSQHPMEVSHATISRRIKDLLDQGYIELSKEEPYRTGQNKKYYAVKSKGFLASLATTSIDQTDSFRSTYPIVAQLTDNEELAKTTMLFFKLRLSTWFQWHIWNGLPLSGLNDVDSYRALSSRVPTLPILRHIFYLHSKERSHLRPPMIGEPISDDELLDYVKWNAEGECEIPPASKAMFELIRLKVAVGMKLTFLMAQEKSHGLAIMIALVGRRGDDFAYPHSLLEEINDPTILEVFGIDKNDRLNDRIAKLFQPSPNTVGTEPGMENLEQTLMTIREDIVEKHLFYMRGGDPGEGDFPEKEIVQFYDSDLKQIIE